MFIHFIVERHLLEDFLKLNCKTGLRTSNVLKLSDLNFHLRGPTDTILCYKKQDKN